MSNPSVSRRNFLRVSMIAGGGMLVGFSALSNSETGDNTETTPFSPMLLSKFHRMERSH